MGWGGGWGYCDSYFERRTRHTRHQTDVPSGPRTPGPGQAGDPRRGLQHPHPRLSFHIQSSSPSPSPPNPKPRTLTGPHTHTLTLDQARDTGRGSLLYFYAAQASHMPSTAVCSWRLSHRDPCDCPAAVAPSASPSGVRSAEPQCSAQAPPRVHNSSSTGRQPRFCNIPSVRVITVTFGRRRLSCPPLPTAVNASPDFHARLFAAQPSSPSSPSSPRRPSPSVPSSSSPPRPR